MFTVQIDCTLQCFSTTKSFGTFSEAKQYYDMHRGKLTNGSILDSKDNLIEGYKNW